MGSAQQPGVNHCSDTGQGRHHRATQRTVCTILRPPGAARPGPVAGVHPPTVLPGRRHRPGRRTLRQLLDRPRFRRPGKRCEPLKTVATTIDRRVGVMTPHHGVPGPRFRGFGRRSRRHRFVAPSMATTDRHFVPRNWRGVGVQPSEDTRGHPSLHVHGDIYDVPVAGVTRWAPIDVGPEEHNVPDPLWDDIRPDTVTSPGPRAVPRGTTTTAPSIPRLLRWCQGIGLRHRLRSPELKGPGVPQVISRRSS